MKEFLIEIKYNYLTTFLVQFTAIYFYDLKFFSYQILKTRCQNTDLLFSSQIYSTPITLKGQ